MQTENTFLKVENLSKSFNLDAPPVFEGINF
jgi:nitrate/nitrite transport system ATP-binding protein